jgi:hypothetical protein
VLVCVGKNKKAHFRNIRFFALAFELSEANIRFFSLAFEIEPDHRNFFRSL